MSEDVYEMPFRQVAQAKENDRLTRERDELLEALRVIDVNTAPIWCPAHEHYKWCECNGGVLGATGYESPARRLLALREDTHNLLLGRRK